jgi:hypothetical protein
MSTREHKKRINHGSNPIQPQTKSTAKMGLDLSLFPHLTEQCVYMTVLDSQFTCSQFSNNTFEMALRLELGSILTGFPTLTP